MTVYDLKHVKLPSLTGRALRAFAAALENPVTGQLLMGQLLKDAGMFKLRDTVLTEPPTNFPLATAEAEAIKRKGEITADNLANLTQEIAASQTPSTPFNTILDFHQAYQAGETTPLEVAVRVLTAIQESDEGERPLRAMVATNQADLMAQAQASAARWSAGQPLSLLDGVPVAVKDELDQTPYPTKVGTRVLGQQSATSDATVVARLRKVGALLIGKANMHEIGINPDGSNAHNGHVRNPYDLDCESGGSSSGPAAATAAGFCPVSIGADGGGSIRVPASHCGLVGLKATFGRISETGAAPLDWSVAHVGPIGATVADVALTYSLIAGVDETDPNTLVQPPVSVAGWQTGHLRGVTLGIFSDWFNHCEPEIAQACRKMVTAFEQAGATIREIEIPELDLMRIAHATTILTEMASSMDNLNVDRKQMAPSTRINLRVGNAATARDYIQAQRVRTRAMAHFAKVFAEVDVIVTPTTAVSAPKIPNNNESGWSDLTTVTEIMRYVFPANFTGHPAISFPVGYTNAGLPIGMHGMGRHWEEHLLLRLAYVAEGVVERKRPFLTFDAMRKA
ncbi:MAG: amidase [Chloroflexota bacterium]